MKQFFETKLPEKWKRIVNNEYGTTILIFILYVILFFLLDLIMLMSVGHSRIFCITSVLFRKIDYGTILFLAAFVSLLTKRMQVFSVIIMSFGFLLYGFAQDCYFMEKGNLFRLGTLQIANEGMKYATDAIKRVPAEVKILYIIGVLASILIIAGVIYFEKKEGKRARKIRRIIAIALLIITGIPFFSINRDYDVTKKNKVNYLDYQVYYFTNPIVVYQQSDYYTYIIRDLYGILSNVKEERNQILVENYFKEKGGHQDNEMTGIFKGKNLMVIQMESMDYRVLNETYSPNLTRLRNEGIDFPNFYTPMFGDDATFGTETAVNTGLFSATGFDTSTILQKYTFPDTLARSFERNGYIANEYHFNISRFYHRGLMAKSYGYRSYNRYIDLLQNKLLDTEIDDVLCEPGLYEQLVKENQFLDYIITYSAHVPYTTDSNRYKEAVKRRPQLAQKTGTDTLGVYKMLGTLTDDMVGKLVTRLDEDGILEDTVLVFLTDHYCYGVSNDKNYYSENDSRRCNTPFFIYCKGMESRSVNKVCQTNDVLPTLLNLFGIEVPDNLVGNDIFDEKYEGIAYFPDFSWITSKCYYNNGKIIKNDAQIQIAEEYINEKNTQVANAIETNLIMLYTDYYASE